MTRIGEALSYTRPIRRQPRAPGVFASVNGEQIHYIDAGSGPAVVLIHGLLGNTFMWRNLLPALVQHNRVIAIDLVGFGFSDRNYRAELSLQAHADRVHNLLNVLGVQRASLVGHSMGGAIAQRMAISHPEHVEQLVLIASLDAERAPVWGSAAQRAYSAARYALFARRLPFAMRMLTASALRRMATSPAGSTREGVFAYSDPLLRPGTVEAFIALFEAVEAEAAADPREIKVPTLVVNGALDRSVLVETGERLSAQIGDSRFVVIDNAGHLCIEEHSEVVAGILLNFLGHTEPPRLDSRDNR